MTVRFRLRVLGASFSRLDAWPTPRRRFEGSGKSDNPLGRECGLNAKVRGI